MRAPAWLMAALAMSVSMPARSAAQPRALPFKSDSTGVSWVLPFKKALAQAKGQERLLVIKPIAFGTDKDGGW